jgi:hypothetical protein
MSESLVPTRPSLHNDAFSRPAWLEEGIPLLLSAMTSQLRIGDWALRTPAEASRDEVRELLEEAAARTGYEVEVISAYRTVAERIPPELRKPGLSWYAYKDISKLSVSENGTVSEEKSRALRTEFIEKFAADPAARIVDIRSAVREKMNKKSVSADETESVSFKLTKAEYASLKDVVQAHPIHDSIPNFVQELVRKFLVSSHAEPSK